LNEKSVIMANTLINLQIYLLYNLNDSYFLILNHYNMKLTKQQQEAQQLTNTIISKCWEDEAFKKELISSPIKAIEKLTGHPVNLPEGVKIVVNDQTDPSFSHINIPAKVDFDSMDMELTDEQLEIVAGGEVVASVGVGILIGATLYLAARGAKAIVDSYK